VLFGTPFVLEITCKIIELPSFFRAAVALW
jgi:hypothetical protein